tara:strand:- start:161 stop:382 length:222 start_codon:yes stop_codon:yes gene_type:complete
MDESYLRVEGHPNLVRDRSSGAILNTEASLGNAAKRRKAKDETIDSMKEELDVLKSDVTEIKSLLKSFLEKHQ